MKSEVKTISIEPHWPGLLAYFLRMAEEKFGKRLLKVGITYDSDVIAQVKTEVGVFVKRWVNNELWVTQAKTWDEIEIFGYMQRVQPRWRTFIRGEEVKSDERLH